MKKPMTDITMLVEGAFAKHHPELTSEKVWDIYSSLTNKPELSATLQKMAVEVFTATIAEPDEKNAVSWKLA
jgi:hypothetical protein